MSASQNQDGLSNSSRTIWQELRRPFAANEFTIEILRVEHGGSFVTTVRQQIVSPGCIRKRLDQTLPPESWSIHVDIDKENGWYTATCTLTIRSVDRVGFGFAQSVPAASNVALVRAAAQFGIGPTRLEAPTRTRTRIGGQ